MASNDKFCLKWNDFETNISGAFSELRDAKQFHDVCIAVDENPAHVLQAHKVMLAACSPFFRNMFLRQGALSGLGAGLAQPNPLIYLRGVTYEDMCHILDFMYHGEVNVCQDDLNSFLQVAEDLKIKGLTQGDQQNSNHAAVPKREPHKREAPPDRENGSAKKRPRPSAPALPPPEDVPEDEAGPSVHVELDDHAQAGPSNIKAEMMTEENFEGAEDYGGGEEESYYDEGAYEGGEDMGVGGAAGGDESKGRLTHFHFSERLVSVAPLAGGVAGFRSGAPALVPPLVRRSSPLPSYPFLS